MIASAEDAGQGPLSLREQALTTREAAADDAEAALRGIGQSLKRRSAAIAALETLAAGLTDREAALRQREHLAWLRDDAARSIEVARAELEAQNSELRQANEKLVMATLEAQELREAAQSARQRQDEFLAMLAHELRNPLAPIRSAVQLMSRLNGKPVPDKILNIIGRQVEHMVRLVDDLLDVSRIIHGKVTLKRQPTAVSEFIQQAIESCRESISSRQQRLTIELPTAAAFVDGDPARLAQIFTNLLQNASRYSPNGGAIVVAVRIVGSAVELNVSDNGVGISAEALPHVFELFAQGERALSRAGGGLGIGLTVVRDMVQLHGGTVEAHSPGPGLGSRFTVTLPGMATTEEFAAGRAVAAQTLTPTHLLIIEDNVDDGETLAELLRIYGHRTDRALDGPSGLQLFESGRPRVVLCDVGLPGMDGFEVAAELRKRPYSPRPVLIAITGYGDARSVERALAAGIDYHLTKPVDPEALLLLIDSALGADESEVPGQAQITSHGSLSDGR